MKRFFNSIFTFLFGAIIGGSISKLLTVKNIDYDKKFKFKKYYELTNHWLMIKNQGLLLDAYFKENNFYKIAIYGMGELGTRLYEELKNTNIKILYAIDENGGIPFSDLDIYSLQEYEKFEDVDVIVITAVFAADEIRNRINKKVKYTIISLEDVIFNL